MSARLARRCAMGLATMALVPACGGSGDPAGPEALTYVPADASVVDYVDTAQGEQRMGIDVSSRSGRQAVDSYLEAVQDSSWLVSDLTPYYAVMPAALWGWNGLDVEWSVGFLPADDQPETVVVGLSDDADLSRFAQQLRSLGYAPRESGLGKSWSITIDQIRRQDPVHMSLLLRMRDVTVLPDARVVVLGAPAAVARARDGGSLADTDSPLLARAGDAEYLWWRSSPSCAAFNEQVLGERTTPELVARQRRQMAGLGQPAEASAAITSADGALATSARLQFGSGDAASDDAEARQAYVHRAASMVTGQPLADLFTITDVTVEGDVETIEFRLDQGPGMLRSMTEMNDLELLACGRG